MLETQWEPLCQDVVQGLCPLYTPQPSADRSRAPTPRHGPSGYPCPKHQTATKAPGEASLSGRVPFGLSSRGVGLPSLCGGPFRAGRPGSFPGAHECGGAGLGDVLLLVAPLDGVPPLPFLCAFPRSFAVALTTNWTGKDTATG